MEVQFSFPSEYSELCLIIEMMDLITNHGWKFRLRGEVCADFKERKFNSNIL